MNFTNGQDIRALAEEGEYLWVGTRGGLVSVHKSTGERVFYHRANSGLPCNDIVSIAIDGQGNKWIGTYGGGVARFDGESWLVYGKDNSGLPFNKVTSIAIDGEGNKWFGKNFGDIILNSNHEGMTFFRITELDMNVPRICNPICNFSISSGEYKFQ